jgi:protein required for attachment to host cells
MARSTWGLAIDGSRARILRDLEDAAESRPLPEELGLEVRPLCPSEMSADRAGPGDAAVSASADAASDAQRQAERDFCAEALWLVGTHLRRGDFDRLVVAAAPRMMEHLRDRRSREIAAATVAECTEDCTHLSPAKLRARLREHLPGRFD